jgi:NitT/TauT family transport system substrate-binding protein
MKPIVAFLIFLGLILPAPPAPAAEKLRIASGGFSAAHSAMWVAVDKKLFQKYGFDVEYILIDSGTVGAQALLSGEIQVLLATGGLVLSANPRGADFTIIGGFVDFFPYQLIARPEIKTPEDLKGKKVAISRFGSASDFAVRLALEKIRLDPNRDVAILQVGAQGARYAALMQNGVQAAIFSEPLSTVTVRKNGMRLLADLGKLDIHFPNTDLIVKASYLQSHRPQLVSFMKAVIEAMHAVKTDRQLGIKTIQKYLRMEEAEEAGIGYDYFVGQHMGKIPEVPSRNGIETAIAMTGGNKEGVTAESLKAVDRSILDEIVKSGFVDALYK